MKTQGKAVGSAVRYPFGRASYARPFSRLKIDLASDCKSRQFTHLIPRFFAYFGFQGFLTHRLKKPRKPLLSIERALTRINTQTPKKRPICGRVADITTAPWFFFKTKEWWLLIWVYLCSYCFRRAFIAFYNLWNVETRNVPKALFNNQHQI